MTKTERDKLALELANGAEHNANLLEKRLMGQPVSVAQIRDGMAALLAKSEPGKHDPQIKDLRDILEEMIGAIDAGDFPPGLMS